MRRHADIALEGLVKNLAEGGVGVHHHGELLDGCAGGDGVGALLDEIRCVHADDVHAEHLASVLVEEALGDAGALELCKGLGVGLERALRLAEFEALGGLRGLGLGLTEEASITRGSTSARLCAQPPATLFTGSEDDESTSPHLPFGRFWLRLKKEKNIF